MKTFLRNRLNLVNNLINDVDGVVFGDIVLILTAVISSCAATKWPGTGIDKGRFVELLVNRSPEEFHTSWVSIPALISSNLIDELDTPWGEPGQQTRVFTDDEIDLSLDDAMNKYTMVSEKELRKHCYASLIYERLRCGYSHEYCAHESITEIQASREKTRVSYIGRSSRNQIARKISFHLDYLIDLADYHVTNFTSSEVAQPQQWWVYKG